jgi:L-fuconolactonase
MRIDAHHHLWKYNETDYEWIGKDMVRLRADFLPSDLHMELDEADIEGVVTVQARQTLEETRWLLELAGQSDFIKGVVGWVPMTSPALDETLEEFDGTKMCGVRHVLQGETDDLFMVRPDFDKGLDQIKEHNLVYDILILERQLPQAIVMVDRHPDQPFVLDHLAKPLIAKGELEPWAGRIRDLAKRENVTCKLSGMVTEADWGHWSKESLQPYFDVVMEAFGPHRLMFGSDWPVCLLAAEYQKWVEVAEDLASGLSDDEFKALFGGTAALVYGLE